ncbi:ribosome hibernation-promoting factor, HPF/YfiA family [Patescibacteria group bacterium]
MQIKIYAKNTSLAPSIEGYIREKIEGLSKYSENIIHADVQIEVFKNKSKGNDLYRAEIMVKIPKKMIRADQDATDIHEAFDLALPKIEKQLNKYQETMRHKDRSFLTRLGTVFSPFARKGSRQADESVIREGADSAPEMTEEEAKDAIEKSSETYVIFRNKENGKFSVLMKNEENGKYILREE